MKLIESQPAHLMYAFEGAWQVMRYVSSSVFARTNGAARTWFDWADDWRVKVGDQDNVLLEYWHYCIVGGLRLAGASQYIAAMILVALFLVLQFVLLVLWVTVSLIMIGSLMLFNLLYGSYYKIFFRCPNSGCYEQMTIPIYVCPNCATDHTRLWPSAYGIFHHRCTCGTRLPTLNILGRKDLVRKCTECNRPMTTEIGRLTNVHIPVIGGPSTGKSNYIFMATRQFIDDYAQPRQYTVSFPDEQDQKQYERNIEELSLGRALPKTPDIRPQAYCLSLKRPRDRVGKIIYIYDAAGEAYVVEGDTMTQGYFKYVHGLIFVIDPFSIDFYYRQREEEIEVLKSALRPSALRVMDAYERMLAVLESSVGLERGRRFRHPIAVVVTKSDALDLDHLIGPPAAQDLMRRKPAIRLEEDAIHLLVEQFLIDNQLGNLVRDLHLQFQQVRFFSCSALGRLPDESDPRPFTPVGVLAPFLWLLTSLNAADAQAERIRQIDADHWSLAQANGKFFKARKYYHWDSLKPISQPTQPDETR